MFGLRRFRFNTSSPWALTVGLLLVGLAFLPDNFRTVQETAMSSQLRAPDFPADLSWVNTDRPLSLRDLQGKIVLLDFWTAGCINCQHVVPDLKRLEAKYPDELVVIGVHSGKFPAEREAELIRQAARRLGLAHPVVNDRDMRVWEAYTVKAWPTLVLIDPRGRIVDTVSGEGHHDRLEARIGELVTEFTGKGRLDRKPLQLTQAPTPAGPLAFPGKVLADPGGKRLFISDTAHHRLVVAELPSGKVQAVIGDGQAGKLDGPFDQARFHAPQGLALQDDQLYVADTGNHLIRQVDLTHGTVKTLAGTGKQEYATNRQGPWRSFGLNSPWDLTLAGSKLYVAMAGNHQLWRLDLQAGTMAPYAGSGREALDDGALAEATLAQPSGLTSDGGRLYVADAESSSIRWADLPPGEQVGTIVGLGLFHYGDRDGMGDAARLQHPQGLAWHAGRLYVADTYNHKIKRVDPATRISETFLGDGEAGRDDGASPRFAGPGGLTAIGDRLYIADTDNHAIRVADLRTKQVSTLTLQGLQPPTTAPAAPADPGTQLPVQTVRPGEGGLTLTLTLPEGRHLNGDSPSYVRLSDPTGRMRFQGRADLMVSQPVFPLTVPVTVSQEGARPRIEAGIYHCTKGRASVCHFWQERLTLPIRLQDGAGSALQIGLQVPPGP